GTLRLSAHPRYCLCLRPSMFYLRRRPERFTFLGAEVYGHVESAALLTGCQRECAGYAPLQPRSSERQLESATAQTLPLEFPPAPWCGATPAQSAYSRRGAQQLVRQSVFRVRACCSGHNSAGCACYARNTPDVSSRCYHTP